jgi:hypothetical protein
MLFGTGSAIAIAFQQAFSSQRFFGYVASLFA